MKHRPHARFLSLLASLPFLFFALSAPPSVALAAFLPVAQSNSQPDPQSTSQQGDDLKPLDPAGLPDTPAGRQTKWVLDVIQGDIKVGDPKDRFSSGFLEQIPPDQIKGILENAKYELFGGADIEWLGLQGTTTDESLTAIIRGKGATGAMEVFIVVDDITGRIAGLRVTPMRGGRDGRGGGGGSQREITDWDAMNGALTELSGTVVMGAYELEHKVRGDPTSPLVPKAIHEFGDDKALAIGSAFKLFVLGALGEQVKAGTLRWDQPHAIDQALKSLPSGRMQDDPAGTEHALSHFAAQMISISDNTATDHLIHLVGRDKVEDYYKRFAQPHQTLPFLTTREMFSLKLANDLDLLARYAAANEEQRRAMLATDGEVAKNPPQIMQALTWKTPRAIDTVEWFATTREVARVWADLRIQEQADGMAEIGKALRLNPGIRIDRSVWTSVGFKGGSEVGVLYLSWLLERGDGRWFILVTGWNDTERRIDERRLLRLANSGIDLIAAYGEE